MSFKQNVFEYFDYYSISVYVLRKVDLNMILKCPKTQPLTTLCDWDTRFEIKYEIQSLPAAHFYDLTMVSLIQHLEHIFFKTLEI